MNIQELPIQQVFIKKVDDFDGFDITFLIENQSFQFLIGNTKKPFPLNVKHVFREKEVCHLCHKIIYPAPYGQQLCKAFQKKLNDLLSYFQHEYQDQLK